MVSRLGDLPSRRGRIGLAGKAVRPLTGGPGQPQHDRKDAVRAALTPAASAPMTTTRAGGGMLCRPDHGAAAVLRPADHVIGEVTAGERVYLADAGGTGDVDLGKAAADHVDPDEMQAVLPQ